MLTASTCFCARPERKCTHPRIQNAIWQRVQVVLSWRGWGGWWGREFALWKVPTDSIALSEMLSLMIRESAACEWALRQRLRTGFGIFISPLSFILLFSFSLAASLFGPKPSVPLFARGLWVCTVCVMVECGQGWVSENVLVDLSQASRGLGESGFFVLCWWKAALDPISLSLTSGHFTSSQFTMIILNPGPNYFSLP